MEYDQKQLISANRELRVKEILLLGMSYAIFLGM